MFAVLNIDSGTMLALTTAVTTATLVSGIALAMAIYTSAANLEQAAQIHRTEKTIKALCGPKSPQHHLAACAEISLPLVIPPSPFRALVPEKP